MKKKNTDAQPNTPPAPVERAPITDAEFRQAVCIEDFKLDFNEAFMLSGGVATFEDLKDFTLSQLAEVLAPSGIRFIWDPATHVDRVAVEDSVLAAVNSLR